MVVDGLSSQEGKKITFIFCWNDSLGLCSPLTDTDLSQFLWCCYCSPSVPEDRLIVGSSECSSCFAQLLFTYKLWRRPFILMLWTAMSQLQHLLPITSHFFLSGDKRYFTIFTISKKQWFTLENIVVIFHIKSDFVYIYFSYCRNIRLYFLLKV